MQLKEVKTKADWKAFHQVSHFIFAQDPYWIAPLESDVEKVFDPKANKAFDGGGEARLWVLYNDQGKGIGRIAAFIDAKRNTQKTSKEGGIGFFDCVNDDAAATMLFDIAENFLRERGINSIQAPVNFGERDKFWGLLIKGWGKPLYHENYHPAYYQRFLDARGYQHQEQIFTFGGKVNNLEFGRLTAISSKVRERYGIQSRMFNVKDLATDGQHMATVYNAAFAHMPHFKPLEGPQIYKTLKQMKPVMDPCLTCIAFVKGEPVGFCALMPDINQSLAFSNGKLKWWKLPRFLYNLKTGQPKIVKGVAFGIHPDYQRRGVFSEMVDYLAKVNDGHNLKTYDSLGLATIRGGNLVMLKTISAALNVYVERVHLSFVRIFEGAEYAPYGSTDITEVPMGEVPDESIYPKG